jgi:hypothetical protein
LTPYDDSKRILIVGEVYVDRHLDRSLIRLGGVFHAARALDACGVNYSVAYLCPSYLDEHCHTFLIELGARDHKKVGNVVGTPNVMEIRDSGEAGDQGYEDLLGDSRRIDLRTDELASHIASYCPTDVLVIAGTFNIQDVLETLDPPAIRVHVDVDHAHGSVSNIRVDTAFCSTTGIPFVECGREPKALLSSFHAAKSLVLKENRGGSRAYIKPDPAAVEADSFPVATAHSVGVGDCFDATWVAQRESEAARHRLRRASYVASLYASTFSHEEFRANEVRSRTVASDVVSLAGTRLPWELRPSVNVYLAAPDFPEVNTAELDRVELALRHHNFSPRRPIRENGLGSLAMTWNERRSLFAKDIALLESCELLIAVPLTNDPGTFAELGWFASEGKATILYDPMRLASNLFVSNLARRSCSTLVGLVDAVFELMGQARRG